MRNKIKLSSNKLEQTIKSVYSLMGHKVMYSCELNTIMAVSTAQIFNARRAIQHTIERQTSFVYYPDPNFKTL